MKLIHDGVEIEAKTTKQADDGGPLSANDTHRLMIQATKLMHQQANEVQTIAHLRGVVARAWCREPNTSKVFDPDLVDAVVLELMTYYAIEPRVSWGTLDRIEPPKERAERIKGLMEPPA